MPCAKAACALLAAAALVVASAALPADGESPETALVSVAWDGAEGNAPSYAVAISADGRVVAFLSFASNLVQGDTNDMLDLFARDRALGETVRVDVASDGSEAADGATYGFAISADGRFVAFDSMATNLVAGDTNDVSDVFVRDLEAGTTTRVSVATDGTEGDGDSSRPAVSADGRIVAFTSQATNLVEGDGNGLADVFLHDRVTGVTTRVSVRSNGAEADAPSVMPSISGDGGTVVFVSEATNLVPRDTNEAQDVFVHDVLAGRTERVSVRSSGRQASGPAPSLDPAVSADGHLVAFASFSSGMVPRETHGRAQVYVHNLVTGRSILVSVSRRGRAGNLDSSSVAISPGGRFVAFTSEATSLVPGDTNGVPDVFVRDRRTRTTRRASVGPGGAQAADDSNGSPISVHGAFVAFASSAPNLVEGDANGFSDVFVRGPMTW